MFPNFPVGILLGGEKTTGWKLYVQTHFQIIDPYYPRLSSNDDNPKIINDHQKFPTRYKFCGKGVGLASFM